MFTKDLLTFWQVREASSVLVRSILLALHCSSDPVDRVLFVVSSARLWREIRVLAIDVYKLIFCCRSSRQLGRLPGRLLHLIGSNSGPITRPLKRSISTIPILIPQVVSYTFWSQTGIYFAMLTYDMIPGEKEHIITYSHMWNA